MSKLHFDSIGSIASLLAEIEFSSIFVLLDENTKRHCYPLVKDFLPQHSKIEINAGERYKTIETCIYIWNTLTAQNAERNALLINVGGGVITDMGGFCASTYKRGIKFINIPTTLLSQVDASVGGKTGIDFQGFKNQIGVFNEPQFVLVDTVFHHTLADKELRSGFAEMLKHGLIADKNHWEHLIQTDFKHVDLNDIKRSVAIKQNVVAEDPEERGLRKILNFGHTIGHALESTLLESKEPLLHGEAIALGMRCEALIAHRLNYINSREFKEIDTAFKRIYGEFELEKRLFEKVLKRCRQDKKNENGEIKMSLLDTIGQANFDIAVSEETIKDAIKSCL